MPVNIFDHHNGIINHKANGKHQCEQREQVDRVTESKQHDHHADERQGYRHDRYNCRTQVSKEQEDDSDNDDCRLPKRLDHFFDRRTDKLRRVIGNISDKPFRQVFLEAWKILANIRNYGQGIGGWCSINPNEYSLQAVKGGR